MKNYRLKEYIKLGLRYSRIKSIAFVIILMLGSCEEFLDVAPKGSIDANAFFSNPSELVFALNGVYALQRNVYGNSLYYQLNEARSDNMKMDQTEQKERVEQDTYEETPGNLLLVNIWTSLYIVINNANTVIERAPSVPTATPAEADLVKRAEAEAKYIRALSYFTLAHMWGGALLRTEPTTDFENAVIARSSLEETYNFIIQDLTEAAQGLPESYDGSSLNEIGRATRYAALALLGKVQLQKGDAGAASSALQGVIGKYSLLPNFADVYAAGNDNTAESIFEVSFNPVNQTGLGFNNQLIPASEATRLGIVAGGQAGKLPMFPTVDITTIYESGDLRADATFAPYEEGNATHYFNKFIDYDAAGTGSDINMVLIRYADVLLMKAEADGESAASYELINQVRRRAFGKDPSVADPAVDIDASTPGTFIEKVMLERRREFVFECQRWLDLKRLPESAALTIINNHIAAEYTGIPAVTAKSFVFPIPQQEIDVSNDVVVQNPGYPN
ncbi:MAG: RagB/SusD family nutrient uptake outer membrane protein [Bacteroidales bacterium]|nr:RagB/SusD family nutrient uptake outer membrane protein [Bacteroidales bacterium]